MTHPAHDTPARPWNERHCESCGQFFKIRARPTRKGEGKFCSRPCATDAMRGPRAPLRQAWIEKGISYLECAGGFVTKVDPDVLPELSRYNWRVRSGKGKGKRPYVARWTTSGPGAHRTTLLLHRWLVNAGPTDLVDHINLDSLDNRRSNLRPCNATQNNHNKHGVPGCASQYKGVAWSIDRKKWVARIWIGGGKSRFLGYHREERDAALAYDIAAREVQGEFACPNLA